MSVKQLLHLGDITFAAGARVSFDIPRNNPLHVLLLRARFTITNGGTGPVGPKWQTLARIFKKVEVLVNGRDNILNLTGASLAAMAFLNLGQVAKGMDATVVTTNSAATEYEITLPIFFTLPPRYAQRADDTALDFRRGIEAKLIVEFAAADCSDFFITPNSAALSGVTVSVSGLYEDGVPADRIYRVRTYDQILHTLEATNSALQLSLDKGSGVFMRGLMIETIAADIYVSTILNDGLIEVAVGSTPIDKVKAKDLLAMNRQDLYTAPQTGVYHLDKTLYGSGISMIPTGGLRSDLVLKLDATKITGTNQIIITRDGFRDLVAVG